MDKTEMVNAEDLGFTEEDIKPFIDELPKEEQTEEVEEQTEEETKPAETTEESTENAPASDETAVPEDHAENLKAALAEERAKRKALRDELNSLKAQVNRPQVQEQPQTQAPDVLQQIRNDARQKAIASLKIDGNPSDLMFVDGEKYEEYISERTRLEYEAMSTYKETQRVFNENVAFANELREVPDYQNVLNYAMAEIDEMPRKESRKIEEAYDRVDKGRGTTADFNVLREYVSTCAKKMTGEDVSVPTKTQPQANVSGLTAKLEQAAALPKAAQLSGGKTSQMSWSEVERLAREEKWDEIPKEMLLKLDPTGSLL